jgi:hypothetical protein
MSYRLYLSLGFLLLTTSMSTFGFLGFGGDSWKEEVLLHDGNKIIATRTVERGGRHEIGQEPSIKEQTLTFIQPNINENVIWEDKFTEDIGSANFLPMQLEMRERVAYLVASPMGCLSYNKWGRPNPPYVVFKYQDKVWQRIALQELPVEFKTPNLIFSEPDHEAKKLGNESFQRKQSKRCMKGIDNPNIAVFCAINCRSILMAVQNWFITKRHGLVQGIPLANK